MVPRTDGKPFPSQAQVDPDRCIGCGVCAGACDTQGIGLTWFDAQQVTRELELFVTAEALRDAPPALAFVCAQSAGGWELFDHVAWARRLPGYSVRPIPCAGWVEPKLVERLINKGASAVLIVGCGSAEPFCREGDTWLPARLSGAREPAFRPNRADPRKVAHVNFDPLRPRLLTDVALALRARQPIALPAARSRLATGAVALVLVVASLALLLPASDAPFRNPEPSGPEFVFTFRALGRWVSGMNTAAPAGTPDSRPITCAPRCQCNAPATPS